MAPAGGGPASDRLGGEPERHRIGHLALPVAPHPVAPVEPVERHEGLAAVGHELHRRSMNSTSSGEAYQGSETRTQPGLRARHARRR